MSVFSMKCTKFAAFGMFLCLVLLASCQSSTTRFNGDIGGDGSSSQGDDDPDSGEGDAALEQDAVDEDVGDRDVDPIEREELPATCEVGERTCDLDRVMQCAPNGNEWLLLYTCSIGEYCEDGQCLSSPDGDTDGEDAPPAVDLRFEAVVDAAVREGEELAFAVFTIVEPADMSVTMEAEGLPENAVFLDSGEGWGTLRFTPDHDQAGIYPIDFKAKAGEATAHTRAIVTVLDVPDVFALPDYAPREVYREDTLHIALLPADWEEAIPDFELISALPETALESDEDGEWLVFQPNENTAESVQMGLRAVSGSEEDTATITVTVRDDQGSTACEAALSYIPGDIYFGTTEEGRNNLTCDREESAGPDMIFRVEAEQEDNAILYLHSTLTGFYPLLYVSDDCIPSQANCLETSHNDGRINFDETLVSFETTQSYYIVVDSDRANDPDDSPWEKHEGSFAFAVYPNPYAPGQMCEFPIWLEPNSPASGNLANRWNLDGAESACNADELPREPDGPEAVYFLRMEERQWITVTPMASDFDPMLALFSECPSDGEDYCRWIIDGGGPGEPERWQNLYMVGMNIYVSVESHADDVGPYEVEASTIPCWYTNLDDFNDPIPDNYPTGYNFTMGVDPNFEIHEILVHFKITHPQFSDLVISLISPDENEEIVLSHQVTTAEQVELTKILEGFDGQFSAGLWTLKIVDTVPRKVGSVQRVWVVFNPDACDEFECVEDVHCPATHECGQTGTCEQR